MHPVVQETAEILRPARRIDVATAADELVRLSIPGGYRGPWISKLVPYMIEPAQCLTRRDLDAVIFVGPAQSAKTQMLIDNWVAHTIACNPMDHAVVQPSQISANDYSQRRIKRLIAASPKLKEQQIEGHGDAMVHKRFRSGAMVSIVWPTKNNLAGKAIPRVALTDYDRMPDDIDKEGAPFHLAEERTKTFMSRGMVVAESSPSKPIIDPQWQASTAHEAPPTSGILGLYNTGDRRRIYGKCPSCGEYFMPQADIEAMQIPEKGTAEERSEAAQLRCTVSGCLIDQSHEREFKRSGIWLRDGQKIDAAGNVTGNPRRSRRATFWMPGWFAAFATWRGIVCDYLYAEDAYLRAGDEEALKAKTNTGLGGIYTPKSQKSRGTEHLADRIYHDTPRGTVPDGVRALIGTVDVQGNRFEAAVWGHGENNERWLVDRFPIHKTADGEPVIPAVYAEHWDAIIEPVINAQYKVVDGYSLRPHVVAVDSGGHDGVTEQAYAWYRTLRRRRLSRRVYLIKGTGYHTAPFVQKSYPDARKRSGRKGGGRGDVPVLIVNSNKVKSVVDADLRRDAGSGYIHFPDWTPQSVFDELAAEQLTDKGWEKIFGRANESWDLLCYDTVLWRYLRGYAINWSNPPAWLQRWDLNQNATPVTAKAPKSDDSQKISIGRKSAGLLR